MLELYCYLVPLSISMLLLVQTWRSPKFAKNVEITSMSDFIKIFCCGLIPIANIAVVLMFFVLILSNVKIKFKCSPKHLK